MSAHAPNESLRELVAESGWTGEQFARAVNAVAAENGVVANYDRTAVSHWLAGRCPRSPIPRLAAEAVTRRLGRIVTEADLGFVRARQGAPSDALGKGTDLMAEMDRLAAGLRRRRVLSAAAYSIPALTVPTWAERPGGVIAIRDERRALTVGQIETAEAMLPILSSADAMVGGGHARPALGRYLAAEIGPGLHASYRPALRQRLFAISTKLTYLCGFVNFDDEDHGAAQGYYRLALDQARHNDDVVSYAIALRAMSVQARHLGHRGQAVCLAEASLAGSQRLPQERKPFLLGQLAVALASTQDRTAALTTLAAAEKLLSQRLSSGGCVGAYHASALALQEAEVRAELGDTSRALDGLRRSLHSRPGTENRSRAITLARLAELQLGMGHLEEAASTWHTFLDLYPALESGRAKKAWASMRALLRPYQRNAAARTVLDRAMMR